MRVNRLKLGIFAAAIAALRGFSTSKARSRPVVASNSVEP